jgi:hypothetical protein
MTRKTRNWLITLFILASPFLFFLGLLLFWTAEPLPPLAPLPNPNGYDDLVKAGKAIRWDVWGYGNANLERLPEFVSTNETTLALARSALSNQCAVPLQFSEAYRTNHIRDLIAFRSLAQALASEGEFAEMEHRFNDAAKSYLDTIHLGNEAERGGVVTDEMIGIPIRSLGLEQLQNIADRLDAKSCRETVKTLEMLDAQRQSWADVLQQENAWSRRNFPNMRGQIVRLYYKLVYYRAREQTYQRAFDIIKSTQKKEGQLLIDLATRAYELDKGHRPASLADLVPEYLKAIPQDPVTGTNLLYSPQ